VIGILLPNLVFSLLKKIDFKNVFKNRVLMVFEQIGRYGSMVLMVFNIPYTYYGFFFDGALWVYIASDAVLVILYWAGWMFFSNNKHPIVKAYVLSIIPSVLFIFSGLLLRNIPLIVLSACFAYPHIAISLNAAYRRENGDRFRRLAVLSFGLAFLCLVFGASFHGERLHPEFESAYGIGVMMGIVCLSFGLAFVVFGVTFAIIRTLRKRAKPGQ